LQNNLRIVAILPARIGSTRLPRKPLLLLGDKPLIARTYHEVRKVFTDVYVATDDSEIQTACEVLDIPCLLTSVDHSNGTTRCLEAYEKLQESFDYIVNVQGDEPFVDEEILQPLLNLLTQDRPDAATLKAPLPPYHSNSNVFVATTLKNEALYFSRSPIPFGRDSKADRFQHIGIYAYTPSALKLYCNLPPTPAEQAESLEQLRWLEHGYEWKVAEAPKKPLSIDTLEDYERAKKLLG
jgi:3-deoxy-manno-octulosonate cytidylyltransferase (CMP-KDO synthetase)